LMVMPRSRSWFMKSMTVSPSCTSPGLDMKPEMFNAWRKIEARVSEHLLHLGDSWFTHTPPENKLMYGNLGLRTRPRTLLL
jgi:hypothetical protein